MGPAVAVLFFSCVLSGATGALSGVIPFVLFASPAVDRSRASRCSMRAKPPLGQDWAGEVGRPGPSTLRNGRGGTYLAQSGAGP